MLAPTKLNAEEERAADDALLEAPRDGLEGEASPLPRPEGRRVPEPKGRGDFRDKGADEVKPGGVARGLRPVSCPRSSLRVARAREDRRST